MGGYNSGRPAQYPTVESARRLDVRQLRRLNYLRPGVCRSWQWTCECEPSGEIAYLVSDRAIELIYGIGNDDGEPEPIRIAVPLRYRPCRYGGRRVYFACPHCYRTCEVIAMASSGRTWGCRRCFQLRYQSQRLSPSDRLGRRADQLYERAGVETADGSITKHKWMRWRTFDRLMDRANNTARRGDDAFAYRLAVLMGRLGWSPEDAPE